MPENPGDQVLTSLRRIIRAIDIHSHDLVRNYSLTGPQLIILKELAGHRDKTVGDLAKIANLSNATVTDILDRLENRALVFRNRSQSDRRKVLVSITEKGEQLAQKAPYLLQEKFLSRFNKLQDWEQTLIISSLQRIAAMMEAKDLEASPVLLSDAYACEDESFKEYVNDKP